MAASPAAAWLSAACSQRRRALGTSHRMLIYHSAARGISAEGSSTKIAQGRWAGENHDGPFSDASGLDLFEACAARLAALGVRTPRIYLADRSPAAYPADVALVEDVRGGTPESLLRRGLPAAPTGR